VGERAVGSQLIERRRYCESIVQVKSSGTTTDLLQGAGVDTLPQRGGIWETPNALGSPGTPLDGNGSGVQGCAYAPFGQIMVGGGGTAEPYQFTRREAGPGNQRGPARARGIDACLCRP